MEMMVNYRARSVRSVKLRRICEKCKISLSHASSFPFLFQSHNHTKDSLVYATRSQPGESMEEEPVSPQSGMSESV